MNLITFSHSGSFKNTEGFFKRGRMSDYKNILNKYGKEGVSALTAATPVDSHQTSKSWDYEIEVGKNSLKISWSNSHIVDGVPIAVIIQYGHGTRNGGYVDGRDYINPAVRPIFDKIVNDIWAEVTK